MQKYVELNTLEQIQQAIADGLPVQFQSGIWHYSESAASNDWNGVKLMLSKGSKYRALVETNVSEVTKLPEDFLLDAVQSAIKEATGMSLLLNIEDLGSIPTKVALDAIRLAMKERNQ